MAIDPQHLLTFAEVARIGSVSKAAQTLHKSQPAISAQLRRLQEEVGESLYTRERYGIRLTPTGHDLLAYAQDLGRSLEGAKRFVQGLKEGSAGRLRVAASTTVAMYLLPKRLKQFHDRYPGTELKLLTGNTQEALDLLKRGEADLAVIEGPVEQTPFDAVVVAEDEIVLAFAPEHPLATRASITLKDLDGLPVVRRELGSGTREVVDRALSAHDTAPHTVLEAKGVDAIKEAVLQGFGAGFISRLAIERECEMGLLVGLSIDADGFKRPLSMLSPRLELSSQTARRFIRFVTEAQS